MLASSLFLFWHLFANWHSHHYHRHHFHRQHHTQYHSSFRAPIDPTIQKLREIRRQLDD